MYYYTYYILYIRIIHKQPYYTYIYRVLYYQCSLWINYLCAEQKLADSPRPNEREAYEKKCCIKCTLRRWIDCVNVWMWECVVYACECVRVCGRTMELELDCAFVFIYGKEFSFFSSENTYGDYWEQNLHFSFYLVWSLLNI